MVRIEEWRVQRRDTEEWMQHRQLPEELRERIRRFDQYKWLAARGVDEREILQELPLDLRREIQKHLCLKLVRRVSNSCIIFIFVACCNVFSLFYISADLNGREIGPRFSLFSNKIFETSIIDQIFNYKSNFKPRTISTHRKVNCNVLSVVVLK